MRVLGWMPREVRTKSSGCQRGLLCRFVSWCEKSSPAGQSMASCSSGCLRMRCAPLRVYTPSGAHALALWSLTAFSCLRSLPDGEQLETEGVERQHHGPSGDISLGVGHMVSHIVRISHLLAVWLRETALTLPVWGEITNNITQVLHRHPRPKKRGLSSMALGQSPPRDSITGVSFTVQLRRQPLEGWDRRCVPLLWWGSCSPWQPFALTWCADMEIVFCLWVPWFPAAWSFPLQLSRRYLITPSSSHDKLWSLFFFLFSSHYMKSRVIEEFFWLLSIWSSPFL